MEGFVREVVDFSSQYGSETSISYTISNIAGQPSTYPRYGDFTQSAVLRTYGNWWKNASVSCNNIQRTPESFISEDFIELRFSEKVYPESIEIYETYNPGAVVRILACDTSSLTKNGTVRWVVLWSGSPQHVPAKARIFVPSPLNQCPFLTDIIRLELNQSHLKYYTELDAVCLRGTHTQLNEIDDQMNLDETQLRTNNLTNIHRLHKDTDSVQPILQERSLSGRSGLVLTDILLHNFRHLHLQDGLSAALDISENGSFDLLPEEVIQEVLSYLDLESLCRLSATSRLFFKHCYDWMQYLELNLQPYWHKITDAALDGLQARCRRIQRLNLSWCGPYDAISPGGACRFLQNCGAELTCLRLACCRFVDGSVVAAIASKCCNLEDLDLHGCRRIENPRFTSIAKLVKLRSLNLYRTVIDSPSIAAIIRSCKFLEHLNLGSCTAIVNYDDFALDVANNCRQLKTLDLWRARGFSDTGLKYISDKCQFLEGLDVGWCTDLRSGTGCFVQLTKKCRHLKKLFFTANRTVCDSDLEAIAANCRELEQLDILGTREVTQQAVLRVLESCPNLKLLDASFCAGIDPAAIAIWTERYPHVDIKCSFQSTSN